MYDRGPRRPGAQSGPPRRFNDRPQRDSGERGGDRPVGPRGPRDRMEERGPRRFGGDRPGRPYADRGPRPGEDRPARSPQGNDDRPQRYGNGPGPRRFDNDRPPRRFDDRGDRGGYRDDRGPRPERGAPDDLPFKSVTKFYPLPGTPEHAAQEVADAALRATAEAERATTMQSIGGATRPKRAATAANASEDETPVAQQSWNEVADWYQEHLDAPDTFHAQVIAPGVTRLLENVDGRRMLDVGCGEGYFSRHFQALKWKVTGVDVAAEMIAKAKETSSRNITYVVDDAAKMKKVRGEFDAAISVLSIQNIELADRALRTVRERLVTGATFVLVTLHPAFRIPQRSHWGWDAQTVVQYRRMDQYLSQDSISIVMHPGAEEKSERTLTYHRPISWYLNTLVECGFTVDRMEEWTSHRESQPGPRQKAENYARQEFPMFLALRARAAAA